MGDASRALVGQRGTENHPRYYRLEDPSSMGRYMVIVDEGDQTSTVCSGMYGWAADWLVDTLQGKPYAPGRRP